MRLTTTMTGLMRPPFQLTDCAIARQSGLEDRLARMLLANGVRVHGFVSAAADYAFPFAGSPSTDRMEDLLAAGVDPEIPVLISKPDWSRTKAALATLGCRRFGFIEDLIFPRGQWNEIFLADLPSFTDHPDHLGDDVAFLLAERLGADPARAAEAAEAGIAFVRAHEIGCCGFGPDDLSMVNPLVHLLAAAGYHLHPGPIIEIGAYVGGMTCSLGLLAQQAGFPVVSFEPGGRHPGHPSLPSDDILADLRANLAAFGLGETVTVVPQPLESAPSALGEIRASVLVIDAEGDVRDKIAPLRRHLAPGALVIVDDYLMGGRRKDSKAYRTRAHVRDLIGAGMLEEMDVVRNGTWIGRYVGPPSS